MPERLETERFFKRVDVLALQVFDRGEPEPEASVTASDAEASETANAALF